MTIPSEEFVSKIPNEYHPKPSSQHAGSRRTLSSEDVDDRIVSPVCIRKETPNYEEEFHSLQQWIPEIAEAHDVYGSVNGACPVNLEEIRAFESLTWFGNNFLAFMQIQAARKYIDSALIDSQSSTEQLQQKISILSEKKTLWAPFADVFEYEEFQSSLKQWIFVPPTLSFLLLVTVLFLIAHTQWHNNSSRFPSPTRWYRKYMDDDTAVGEDTEEWNLNTIQRERHHEIQLKKLPAHERQQAPSRGNPALKFHAQQDHWSRKQSPFRTYSNTHAKYNSDDTRDTRRFTREEFYNQAEQMAHASRDYNVFEHLEQEQKSVTNISKRVRAENWAYAVSGFTLATSQIIAFFQFFASASHMLSLVEDLNLMAVLYLLAILSQMAIGGCLMVLGLLPLATGTQYGLLQHKTIRWIRMPRPDMFLTTATWLLYIVFFAVAYEATQLSTGQTRSRYMLAAFLLFLAGGIQHLCWGMLFPFMHGDVGCDGHREAEQTNSEDRHLRMYATVAPWLLAGIASALLCIPHTDVVLAFFHRTDSYCWYFWPVWPLLLILSIAVLIVSSMFLCRAATMIMNTCGSPSGSDESAEMEQFDARVTERTTRRSRQQEYPFDAPRGKSVNQYERRRSAPKPYRPTFEPNAEANCRRQ
jgi:hypothetical protein